MMMMMKLSLSLSSETHLFVLLHLLVQNALLLVLASLVLFAGVVYKLQYPSCHRDKSRVQFSAALLSRCVIVGGMQINDTNSNVARIKFELRIPFQARGLCFGVRLVCAFVQFASVLVDFNSINRPGGGTRAKVSRVCFGSRWMLVGVSWGLLCGWLSHSLTMKPSGDSPRGIRMRTSRN